MDRTMWAHRVGQLWAFRYSGAATAVIHRGRHHRHHRHHSQCSEISNVFSRKQGGEVEIVHMHHQRQDQRLKQSAAGMPAMITTIAAAAAAVTSRPVTETTCVPFPHPQTRAQWISPFFLPISTPSTILLRRDQPPTPPARSGVEARSAHSSATRVAASSKQRGEEIDMGGFKRLLGSGLRGRIKAVRTIVEQLEYYAPPHVAAAAAAAAAHSSDGTGTEGRIMGGGGSGGGNAVRGGDRSGASGTSTPRPSPPPPLPTTQATATQAPSPGNGDGIFRTAEDDAFDAEVGNAPAGAGEQQGGTHSEEGVEGVGSGLTTLPLLPLEEQTLKAAIMLLLQALFGSEQQRSLFEEIRKNGHAPSVEM